MTFVRAVEVQWVQAGIMLGYFVLMDFRAWNVHVCMFDSTVLSDCLAL